MVLEGRWQLSLCSGEMDSSSTHHVNMHMIDNLVYGLMKYLSDNANTVIDKARAYGQFDRYSVEY